MWHLVISASLLAHLATAARNRRHDVHARVQEASALLLSA